MQHCTEDNRDPHQFFFKSFFRHLEYKDSEVFEVVQNVQLLSGVSTVPDESSVLQVHLREQTPAAPQTPSYTNLINNRATITVFTYP